MEELLSKLDAEAKTRFDKPWSKLDKGCRLNRLSQFVKIQKTTHELNDEQEKRLKVLLFQLCESSSLNKGSDVVYEDSKIMEIKNYINIVIKIETKLDPYQLFNLVKQIEILLGRKINKKSKRWMDMEV